MNIFDPHIEDDFFLKKYRQKDSYWIVLSLRCGITRERIQLPLRSVHCKNHQAFHFVNLLMNFEMLNLDIIPCPICKTDMQLRDIKTDKYLEKILMKIKDPTIDSVKVYPDTGVFYGLKDNIEVNMTYNDFVKNLKYFYMLRRKYRQPWKIMNNQGDKIKNINKMKVLELSLQCPLDQNCQIKVPIRSIYCNHIQCFDAKNFFVKSCQKGNFNCSICSADMHEENLMIDKTYFNVIDFIMMYDPKLKKFDYNPQKDTIQFGDQEMKMDKIIEFYQNEKMFDFRDDYFNQKDSNDNDKNKDEDELSEEYDFDEEIIDEEGKKSNLFWNCDNADKLLKELGDPLPDIELEEFENFALFPDYTAEPPLRFIPDHLKGKFDIIEALNSNLDEFLIEINNQELENNEEIFNYERYIDQQKTTQPEEIDNPKTGEERWRENEEEIIRLDNYEIGQAQNIRTDMEVYEEQQGFCTISGKEENIVGEKGKIAKMMENNIEDVENSMEELKETMENDENLMKKEKNLIQNTIINAKDIDKKEEQGKITQPIESKSPNEEFIHDLLNQIKGTIIKPIEETEQLPILELNDLIKKLSYVG